MASSEFRDIRNKYWLAPESLSPARAVHRLLVQQAAVREVAGGRCVGSISVLLKALVAGRTVDDANQHLDLLASAQMTGTFHLLSESWQGPGQVHYCLKLVYVEDTVCLVNADASLGEEPEVESLWFSMDEFKALSLLTET